ALNKPTIMISGFSPKWYEFQQGNYRVYPDHGCRGCFSDPTIPFDRGDWNWCANAKRGGTPFECAQNISVRMVIKAIEKLRIENNV
ncbi:unnamed protein product, partial [marine sediment metagenome]